VCTRAHECVCACVCVWCVYVCIFCVFHFNHFHALNPFAFHTHSHTPHTTTSHSQIYSPLTYCKKQLCPSPPPPPPPPPSPPFPLSPKTVFAETGDMLGATLLAEVCVSERECVCGCRRAASTISQRWPGNLSFICVYVCVYVYSYM